MPFWKKQLSFFLLFLISGCKTSETSGHPAVLEIRSATIESRYDGNWLIAALHWDPDSAVLEAINKGIPVTLRLSLHAEHKNALGWYSHIANREYSLEIRYYPLSRQYQLGEIETNKVRSFSASAYLFDALEELRLPAPASMSSIPGDFRYKLNADLDISKLPGALGLPAIMDPGWRLKAKEYRWNL